MKNASPYYFESAHIRIFWDEQIQCVVGEWLSFAKGKDFREPLVKGLELARNMRARRWLADTRKLGVITQDDLEWHEKDLIPQFVQAGVRYVATVVPNDVFAKWSLEALKQSKELKESALIVNTFGTLDDAKAWLKNQL